MASVVSLEKQDDVGIVWIDNPPVNAISSSVREGIVSALHDAEEDQAIKVLVIACRGRTFMAGADISEFKTPPTAHRQGSDLSAELAAFSKPVVAALHGTAFGGGFEIALACDFRVATSDAKVGLPEVKLGLLPGGGGTQRLPRLIGVEPALKVMLSGNPMNAREALKVGAIDEIAKGDLLEDAIAFARARAGNERRRIDDRTIDPASLPSDFFERARASAKTTHRNQHAPQRIIDSVEAAVNLSFIDGRKVERENFLKCRQHPQSRALQHAFFAERKASKVPDMPSDLALRPVASAAVVGAGTMGGGIAMSFVNAGIPVKLLDSDQGGLDRGLSIIRRNYEISATRGKLTQEGVEKRMALITPTLSYDDLSDCDMIVEAVFETMELKKTIFTKLDRVAKPGAILASNTSRLSIDEMSKVTSRPGDVIGTHFFSPANVMKLCEIVRGPATASDVLLTTLAVAKRIGKIGVVSADSNGFIGNAMLLFALQQVSLLLLEGATPQDVDRALFDFGMAMGPFQVSDLAGLDVSYKSRRNYDPATVDWRTVTVADRLVEMGRCGQKSGAGYYDYDGRTHTPSKVVLEVIAQVAQEYQVQRRKITADEIVQRYMLAMVNEGCNLLDRGVAYRASDIDLVFLNGYGHPAYRGGPMFWAENEIGLAQVLEKVREYSIATGERWLKPAPLLARLVQAGKSFADFDANPAQFRHY